MVQEMANQSIIPDDLYNLTQLAEVTLAASKLSTTDIHQIKNYIEREDERKVIRKITENENLNHWNKMDFSMSHPLNFYRDHSVKDVDSLSYFSDESKHSVIKYEITTNESENESVIRKYSTVNGQEHASISSYSFSDDDSAYKYSHKKFERKRTRKFSSIEESDGDYRFENKNQILTDEIEEMQDESIKSDLNEIGSIDDIHICPECGKKYSTSSNLARHRQTHRSLQDKKARKCPHCEKIYVSMPAFSMHVRTHNQGCECSHCGKRFSRPWLLQGHIRTHTGEKPFKCSVCPKAFADKSNLRAHIQTHSNTKPHACSRCGKSFALKSYLYKHEESSCMKNNRDKVKCDDVKKVNNLRKIDKEDDFISDISSQKDVNFERTSVIRKTINSVIDFDHQISPVDFSANLNSGKKFQMIDHYAISA